MYKIITEWDFMSLMEQSTDQFTRGGLLTLFDYLEETSDMGEDIEFDAVGIRCEFTEYDNLEEVLGEYENLNITDIEELENYTTVLQIAGTDRLIIADF